MEKMDQYTLNKVFTIPYMDSIISGKNAPITLVNCIRRYVNDDNMTFGEAISCVYDYMGNNYRNEYYFKNTIFNKLLIQKHDLYKTAALTELPIGKSKADFVMINGRGIVYEIKTDLDNLLRLKNQIEDYYKIFSYVYVVVGKKQLEAVKTLFAETKTGIYELNKSGNLICRKKAKCERSNLSYEAMFGTLRKYEFESILLKHYGKLPGVNAFEYYRECLKYISKINIQTLQKDVMECLKRRTLMVIEKPIEIEVPYELRFYAYFSKKYRSDYDDILSFLDRKAMV